MREGVIIQTHVPPYSEPDTRHDLRVAARSAELSLVLSWFFQIYDPSSKLFYISSIHEELPVNTLLKIPQCVPSVCDVTLFHFTYSVYKDLAEMFDTTDGQIMAFNGGYNYSESASVASVACITVPMGCTSLDLKVTEEI
ncbi:hypothetical protein PITC_029780 [Penicillium italicum]|uniref:Uncharacterized protein n=1 Tax=Penicillium italicum TaxID=40296 RepID=A0A0A2L981_PENIT|nr:hypothetical protein PITC_029780 [Penicillium italicum]